MSDEIRANALALLERLVAFESQSERSNLPLIDFVEDYLRGHGVPGDRESLSRIALDLCERERLDAVVLAGTDLSVLFDSEDPAFPSVDCSLVHIRAIAERL